MAQTSPDSTDITADSMTVSGPSVTFSGLIDSSVDDDEGNTLPESWVAGAQVTIIAPANFQISTSSGYSLVTSDIIAEINPYPGMPVTLEINGAQYELFIATYTPKQDAVPGVGGTAAAVRGNAAPTTYDFSVTGLTTTLTRLLCRMKLRLCNRGSLLLFRLRAEKEVLLPIQGAFLTLEIRVLF